ncbi:MAG: hypothetical protein AVDCRST_MAG66-4683 [uncultured Pseudonocardia sp.]|uniref:Uncharacterized protein n=1 Tax=uncultured Pseudonocardia sp. TaxID=211455 RepID=A0A6J4QT48_9PSEU|nr:MAG: hypothetical protein AVDCRST_MAG66-4683 [uncultured Pseudonocardia sp.]
MRGQILTMVLAMMFEIICCSRHGPPNCPVQRRQPVDWERQPQLPVW